MGEVPDGKTLRDTVPFELRGFSLPLVVFSVGRAFNYIVVKVHEIILFLLR